MRLKVNEIINWCKGGTAMIAAILSLTALGEPAVNLTVETAQKGKILNTANIVTNVSATLSGMEDLASVEIVSNIVEGYDFATPSITNGLRSKTDLAVYGKVPTDDWTFTLLGTNYPLTKVDSQNWISPTNNVAGETWIQVTLGPYIDEWTATVYRSVYDSSNNIYMLQEQAEVGGDGSFEDATTFSGTFSIGTFTATRVFGIAPTSDTLATSSEVAAATNGLLSSSGGTVTGAVTIVRRDAYEGSAKTIFTIADQGFSEGVYSVRVSFKPFKNFSAFFTGMQFTGLLKGSLHIPSWNDFGVESYDESTDAPYLQTVPMLIAPITNALIAVSNTAEIAVINAGIAESNAQSALEALPHKQDTLPYLTNAIPYSVLTGTPTIPTVPTNVSAFDNDSGYVTASITNGYITAETATNIAESAVASADTTYRLTVGVTNLNQSVQYVALDDTTTELAIALPTGDGAKDWLVYVNAATNTTLILPAATWWMSDEAFTNALPAGLTALYFSQISTNGVYSLGRQEMTPITIAP